MAFQTDEESLANLVETSFDLLSTNQYASKEQNYLIDNNNGSYSQEILFDTQPLSGKHVVLSEAVLCVPLSIAPNTGNFSTLTQLAWKTSALSLIDGLTVTDSQGTVLVSEQGLLVNNFLSPIVQNSVLDVESTASLISYYGPDKTLVATPLSSVPSDVVATRNATLGTSPYNPSLLSRVRSMGRYFNATSGRFELLARIPLKSIHSYFASQNFPMLNNALKITFTLSHQRGFSPFVYSNSSDVTPAYTVSIGGLTRVVDGLQMNSARIEYDSITLGAADRQLYMSMLKNDTKKCFEYESTQVFKMANLPAAANYSGVISGFSINSSITKPTKVALYSTNVNALSSPTDLCNSGSMRFNQLNLAVNNTNYFNQNISSDVQLYRMLQSTYADARLTFDEFATSNMIPVIDLSRLQLVDVNSSVSLQFSANYTSTAAADLYFVVKRLITLETQFGEQSTKSIIFHGIKK